MAKITLHGMFARIRGKLNKSETLYFKRCPCKREQLGVDLLNPSKATHAKNVLSQTAFTTAAQAAKTALAIMPNSPTRAAHIPTRKRPSTLSPAQANAIPSSPLSCVPSSTTPSNLPCRFYPLNLGGFPPYIVSSSAARRICVASLIRHDLITS